MVQTVNIEFLRHVSLKRTPIRRTSDALSIPWSFDAPGINGPACFSILPLSWMSSKSIGKSDSSCATISLATKFRPDTSEICPGSDERHRYFTLFSRDLMAKSFSSFVDWFLLSITMNIVLCSPYPRATIWLGITKLSLIYITARAVKNRKLCIDL